MNSKWVLPVVCLATKLAAVIAFIPDTGEINPNLTETDFSNGIMPVVQWLTKGTNIPAASSFEAVSSAVPMNAFATLVGPFGPVPGVQVSTCSNPPKAQIDANNISDA